MPQVPQRRPSRQITAQAPTPRQVGLSGAPGEAAFGSVGATLISQQADVMKDLAEEELDRMETQERAEMTKQLADFQIDSTQSVDRVRREKDEDTTLVQAVMDDRKAELDRIVANQPQFLQAETQQRGLSTLVGTAQSAIAEQERIARNQRVEAAESGIDIVTGKYLADDLDASQSVAQIQSTLSNTLREDELGTEGRDQAEGASNQLIRAAVKKAGLSGDFATARQEIQMFMDAGGSQRVGQSALLDIKKAQANQLLTARKNVREGVRMLATDPAAGIAKVAANSPEVLSKVQEVFPNSDLSSLSREEKQRLIARNKKALDAAYDSRNVRPENRRFLTKQEANTNADALRRAAESGGVQDVMDELAGLTATAERRGLSEQEYFRDLSALSDIAQGPLNRLLDVVENPDNVPPAYTSALVEQMAEPDAVVDAENNIETRFRGAELGSAEAKAFRETVLQEISPFVLDQMDLARESGASSEVEDRIRRSLEDTAIIMASNILDPGSKDVGVFERVRGFVGTESGAGAKVGKKIEEVFQQAFSDTTIINTPSATVSIPSKHEEYLTSDVLDSARKIMVKDKSIRNRLNTARSLDLLDAGFGEDVTPASERDFPSSEQLFGSPNPLGEVDELPPEAFGEETQREEPVVGTRVQGDVTSFRFGGGRVLDLEVTSEDSGDEAIAKQLRQGLSLEERLFMKGTRWSMLDDSTLVLNIRGEVGTSQVAKMVTTDSEGNEILKDVTISFDALDEFIADRGEEDPPSEAEVLTFIKEQIEQ